MFSRLLKNKRDFDYVARYNISRYKATLRKNNPDGFGNISHYFDGVDAKGNKVVIEVANTGHKSSSGGFEPPHIKIQIKDADNKVIHNAKYFLEDDIYRITGK